MKALTLGLLSAMLTAVWLSPTQTVIVQTPVTSEQRDALDWALTQPFADLWTPRPKSAGDVLAHVAASNLAAMVAQHTAAKQAAIENSRKALAEKVKGLPPQRCAALAKDLGVTVESLPCGGGQ